LSFFKTSTETKNETVLGREGLNTILAYTQREDFGEQGPVCACSAHIFKDGRKGDPTYRVPPLPETVPVEERAESDFCLSTQSRVR
jgi:hypothetical protein